MTKKNLLEKRGMVCTPVYFSGSPSIGRLLRKGNLDTPFSEVISKLSWGEIHVRGSSRTFETRDSLHQVVPQRRNFLFVYVFVLLCLRLTPYGAWGLLLVSTQGSHLVVSRGYLGCQGLNPG